MDISVIIVTYNEEINIQRCLDSLVSRLEISKLNYEIILVDSLSTDRTIQLAEKYNIKKIILTNFRSPSTAKNVGFLNSKGNYLLFLDGDMEFKMSTDNLNICLKHLSKKKVAGVQGYLVDYIGDSKLQTLRKKDIITSVNGLPGSAIYSRDSLDLENFNPNLNSNEERELGYRLKKLGFQLLLMPFLQVKHNRKNLIGGFKEVKRRHLNNYYLGLGQVLRANLFSMLLFKHILDQKINFIFISSFILLFSYIFFMDFQMLLSFLFFHFTLCSYYLFSYRSLSRYFSKYVSVWGILYGFLSYRKVKIKYEIL